MATANSRGGFSSVRSFRPMTNSLPIVPVRVLRADAYDARIGRTRANSRGHCLAFGDGVVLTFPGGLNVRAESPRSGFIDADLSDDDRVALLTWSDEGGSDIRIVVGSTTTTVQADALLALDFAYACSGKIRWIDPDHVLLAGLDRQTQQVGIHVVALDSGASRASAIVPDPFGSASMEIVASPDRHVHYVNLDGGQDGSVAHRVSVTHDGGVLAVEPAVAHGASAGDRLRVGCQLLDGTILTIDPDGLVRRMTRDGTVLGSVDATRQWGGYPVGFETASIDACLVDVSGSHTRTLVVSADNLSVLGRVELDDAPQRTPAGEPASDTLVLARHIKRDPFDFIGTKGVVLVWQLEKAAGN